MATERRIGGKHGKILDAERVEAFEKRQADRREKKKKRKLLSSKPKRSDRERHITRRRL